ncbi:MAG: hypothetical protein JXO48_06175 [Deltaproteobacteria bacterium]|nr:hypothetical protein [Deltaproteobacteria bacterium]
MNETSQKNASRLTTGTFFLTALFLLVLLLAAYSNSFQGDWHFDDYYSIVDNVNVHLKKLSWPDIKKTFYRVEGHLSKRPIPFFTFALNYYFGRYSTFGYHLVNFAIHYVSSLFLFLFLMDTLRLPLLKDRYGSTAFPLALLATVLWAISPVHVPAVSIIVQRITCMAALFYIMAMYFYLKGRTAPSRGTAILFYSLCLISAILAFLSKQNAAMLPVSIFLFDLFLIQGVSGPVLKKNFKILILVLIPVVILGSLYTDYASLLNGYKIRPFSLDERLLTEARIIVFYMSLLLYPAGSRLTFLHDVKLSTSLFHPWTTLPAILFIIAILTAAFIFARKRPLLSYCVIFFFLNHIIESSFIPLELIYEHRNYLPSMLFFVPLAAGIIYAYRYFASRRKALAMAIAFVTAIIIILQGNTVFLRNSIFATETSFWLDNLEKAPKLSRPNGEIGRLLLSTGNPQAVEYLNRALELQKYAINTEPYIYLINLAYYYLMNADDVDRALHYYDRALQYGARGEVYDGIALALLKKGDLEGAFENSWKARYVAPTDASIRFNYALVLLKSGRLREAAEESITALELNEHDPKPLKIIGEVMHRMGEYEKAIRAWEDYGDLKPDDVIALLVLADLYRQTGNHGKLSAVTGEIMRYMRNNSVTFEELFHEIDRSAATNVYVPCEKERETLRNLLDDKQ